MSGITRESRNEAGRPLSARFPRLAASPTAPAEVRRDLAGTEADLASRLRRGKANRLRELGSLERDLEVVDLREMALRLDSFERVFRSGSEAPTSLLSLVDSSSPSVRNEALYALDSIQVRPQLRVLPHHWGAIREDLLSLKLDEIGVALFRNLTSPLRFYIPRLGPQRRISRQALWERSWRIQSKMWDLRKTASLNSLVESMNQLTDRRAAEMPAIPTSSGLISLALVDPEGPFPTVGDAVRLGLWIWSASVTDENVGFDERDSDQIVPPGIAPTPHPLFSIDGYFTQRFDSDAVTVEVPAEWVREKSPKLSKFSNESFR